MPAFTEFMLTTTLMRAIAESLAKCAATLLAAAEKLDDAGIKEIQSTHHTTVINGVPGLVNFADQVDKRTVQVLSGESSDSVVDELINARTPKKAPKKKPNAKGKK